MNRNILASMLIAGLTVSSAFAADINFTGTDLATAIAGATAGDRILVNTNGPLDIEDIFIDKNLTIEAGSGFSPVISVVVDTDVDAESGIEINSGAIVSLIGLSFTDAGNSTGVSLLEVNGAGSVLNLTDSAVSDSDQHNVKVQNGAEANITNSTISNAGGDGVRVDDAGILTITGSTVSGGDRNVQFDSEDPANLSINAVFTNSRFVAAREEAILMDDNSAAGESTGNVLIIDQCDVVGFGTTDDTDGILIDDGDVEFTTLEITNNHINPATSGGAAIKLDNKWGELNSSTTLIDNNLIWFTGVNDQSGIQVENMSGIVQITNNTVYNFGEGSIIIDRDDDSFTGTFTITGNLLIEWDETLATVPGLNIGAGLSDELAGGTNVTSDNNVLIDTSNTNFFNGVTPGAGDVTGTDASAHVVSLNPADPNFLQRTGSAGSTLSGATSQADWLLYN